MLICTHVHNNIKAEITVMYTELQSTHSFHYACHKCLSFLPSTPGLLYTNHSPAERQKSQWTAGNGHRALSVINLGSEQDSLKV